MALLEVDKVTKRFGGVVALDGVSMSISKGELVAIIGPNGSGKTTLFNVINGIIAPDSGRILLDGRDITKEPPYRRVEMGIARTFQIPRPWNNLSVRENVAVGAIFGRRGYNVRDALRRADEILELVGLYDKKHDTASGLTVTEKKLLELARSIAMEPRVLLLDEIVAGMSPRDVERMIRIVRNVRDELRISIVSMVEHVIRAVKIFAERVIVLHQGRVLAEGSPEDVLRDKRVVEIYLGSAEV